MPAPPPLRNSRDPSGPARDIHRRLRAGRGGRAGLCPAAGDERL